jgi:riboflavin synthase
VFTGLIEEVGLVQSLSLGEIKVGCSIVLEGSKIGDSIAVNGVCLTVSDLGKVGASFRVSPETQRLTNLAPGRLMVGAKVNLERALRYSDRLGGHMVSGHVDGLARVVDVVRQGDFVEIEIQYPNELRAFVARKGSVAIDGISLTVAALKSSSFTVAVIPQTLSDTNLSHVRVGSLVHIEVDMFARYVHRMIAVGAVPKEVL